jgi:hypothetical protein
MPALRGGLSLLHGVRAVACCGPAGDWAIRYGRGRPLRQPTGPGQPWMMRMPGPERLRQAPGHPPAHQARAGIAHAALPGRPVALSRAQVENQVLPDRLHLMHAAAVMALVGDVCHWAPARENGGRRMCSRSEQKAPDLPTVATCRCCSCRGPEQHRNSTPPPRPKIGRAATDHRAGHVGQLTGRGAPGEHG